MMIIWSMPSDLNGSLLQFCDFCETTMRILPCVFALWDQHMSWVIFGQLEIDAFAFCLYTIFFFAPIFQNAERVEVVIFFTTTTTSLLWFVLQMLSMRNRLSLHPMCLPGVQQPAQLPQMVMSSFGEGNGYLNSNSSSGMGRFPGNEESCRQSVYNLGNQCTLPNQPYIISSGTNTTILETSFGFEESSRRAHCEPLNLSYSKVVPSPILSEFSD